MLKRITLTAEQFGTVKKGTIMWYNTETEAWQTEEIEDAQQATAVTNARIPDGMVLLLLGKIIIEDPDSTHTSAPTMSAVTKHKKKRKKS